LGRSGGYNFVTRGGQISGSRGLRHKPCQGLSRAVTLYNFRAKGLFGKTNTNWVFWVFSWGIDGRKFGCEGGTPPCISQNQLGNLGFAGIDFENESLGFSGSGDMAKGTGKGGGFTGLTRLDIIGACICAPMGPPQGPSVIKPGAKPARSFSCGRARGAFFAKRLFQKKPILTSLPKKIHKIICVVSLGPPMDFGPGFGCFS